jgi:hypothetical protein
VKTDLTDRIFGRLIVLDLAGITDDGKHRWECLCECGGRTVAQGHDLLRGHTQSCGCLRKERLAETGRRKAVPISPGARFGMLTILGDAGRDEAGRQLVRAQCDCGNPHTARWLNVRHRTRSCGCQKQMAISRAPSKQHHWRQAAVSQ